MRLPVCIFAAVFVLALSPAAETLYLSECITAGPDLVFNDLLVRPSLFQNTGSAPIKIDSTDRIIYLPQQSLATVAGFTLSGSIVGEGVWIIPYMNDKADLESGLREFIRNNGSGIAAACKTFSFGIVINIHDWLLLSPGVQTVQATDIQFQQRERGNFVILRTVENDSGTLPVTPLIPGGEPEAAGLVPAGTEIEVMIYRNGILITAQGRVNRSTRVGEETRGSAYGYTAHN